MSCLENKLCVAVICTVCFELIVNTNRLILRRKNICKKKCIYSFFYTHFILCEVVGSCCLSPVVIDLFTNLPNTCTHIYSICIYFFNCERKLKTCTCTGRVCKLYTERLQPVVELGTLAVRQQC